jgi:hypothetical protein
MPVLKMLDSPFAEAFIERLILGIGQLDALRLRRLRKVNGFCG